jgi:RNA polymerase sigma factor (sigma-70 family)
VTGADGQVRGTAATAATAAAVTAVWRAESARLIGGLTRTVRDVSLAEDLAQDALVAALEQWPAEGVPANPGAWLTAVARRRAVDHVRRSEVHRRHLAGLSPAPPADGSDPAGQVDHIEDDVLRLMFLTCHPALPAESKAALTLRLVAGLTTEEIARAFLVKDATMGQRISRAKRTLTEIRATFEEPAADDRRRRLDDVLAVVYLIFNEGYTATAGPEWMRPDLCAEALRLARMLTALAPDDPEVHGLRALLELQASRLRARTGPDGEPVLLEAQDRSRWDPLMIRRGLSALARAEGLGPAPGAYTVQAAIAACHARARTPEETDWHRIAVLYDALGATGDHPVVEVNRAVAHGRAHGPARGLAVLDAVAGHPALARSHLVPSVRGDLLARAGRTAEAAAEFRAAAALTRNARERALLTGRATALEPPS